MKRLDRKNIKYRGSPDWEKVFGFVDSIMENLPDIPMYIVGYRTCGYEEFGEDIFHLVVCSAFEVSEEFVIGQFTGYYDFIFSGDGAKKVKFEVGGIESHRVGLYRKEEIRGIYGIPVYSDEFFLGGAIFYSTREPEELFEDKKSTALMSALAQSACYSISYREQSREYERMNDRLFELNGELKREVERRSRLAEITKKFRAVESKGKLFRVAVEELSKLIDGREVKLKIYSKTRNAFCTECAAKDGVMFDIDDIELVRLPVVRRRKIGLLNSVEFGPKDLPRVCALVKLSRNYFVNGRNSDRLPAGIFPFRMGREVDGVLFIGSCGRCGKLKESDVTIINLFAQILGYSFLLLENL